MPKKLQMIITNNWTIGGHQMKLIFAEKAINFVGYTCPFDDHGPMAQHACPDLKRAVKNSGISCSPGILQAYREQKWSDVASIAQAKALSRAGDFAGILPTVSRKYLEYAAHLRKRGAALGSVDEYELRELKYRMGVDHVEYPEMVDRIEYLNANVHPQEEMVTLKAIGCECTAQELATFSDYPWQYDCLNDVAGYAGSLPASWKN
jgi:hypothetical protein